MSAVHEGIDPRKVARCQRGEVSQYSQNRPRFLEKSCGISENICEWEQFTKNAPNRLMDIAPYNTFNCRQTVGVGGRLGGENIMNENGVFPP